MSWTSDVWTIVRRLPEKFTLGDVYKFKEELATKHPGNRHVEAKIRQQLQVLRDERKIEFVDNRGSYRRRGPS